MIQVIYSNKDELLNRLDIHLIGDCVEVLFKTRTSVLSLDVNFAKSFFNSMKHELPVVELRAKRNITLIYFTNFFKILHKFRHQ
jgi:hypothetical protein